VQMVLTREMIGPDRRLALLSWENGSGANDVYFDGSCKGCVAPPASTETAHSIAITIDPNKWGYIAIVLYYTIRFTYIKTSDLG
jgi:hypothetical protein